MRSSNRPVKKTAYYGITAVVSALVVLFLIGVIFPSAASESGIPADNIVTGNEKALTDIEIGMAKTNSQTAQAMNIQSPETSKETSETPQETDSLPAISENVQQPSAAVTNTGPSENALPLNPDEAAVTQTQEPSETKEATPQVSTGPESSSDASKEAAETSAEASRETAGETKRQDDQAETSAEPTDAAKTAGEEAIPPPSLLEIISRSIFSYKTLLSREMPFIYGTDYIAQDIESLLDEHEMAPEEIPEEIQLEIKKIQDEKEESVHSVPSGEGAQVLIYHTHTLEAYRQVADSKYKESSRWRTNDQTKSVVRVGDVLQKELETYGFDVLHDKTNHEKPELNTAYNRSLATIKKYMEKNKSLRVFIDLHRDAGTNKNDVVTIDGKRCARVMFVVGMGKSSSVKPDWKQNFKLAQTITDKLNAIKPGFARDVRVKEIRSYNQYVSDLCMLIEVGHNGITLEEAENTIPYLAKALNQVIKVKK